MIASLESQNHYMDHKIPGTQHLIDLEGTLAAKHANSASQKDIVLIPTPSLDPDDPLNWTLNRKRLATASLCMYTMMVGIASAAIYSVLTPIANATGLTLDELNDGTGYMFLAFGWGCLVWQPLALQYGKRPVYLFSILATLGIMIWVPYTSTNGQWITSKLLQGFVGAPIESLCEISIADIYFQHERGTYMGLYAFMLAGSNFIAPIMAGFINDGQGWKWVQYWCAIFLGIAFIFCFLFMEETNYDRAYSATSLQHDVPVTAAAPLDRLDTVPTVLEKDPAPEKLAGIAQFSTPPSPEIGQVFVHDPPKSYAQKLTLFSSSRRQNNLLHHFLRPLVLLSLPSVVYAGFSYGSNLVWFNLLNGTTSLILSGAPYNFSSSMVGLSYIAALLGVLAGSLYSGPLGDKIVLRVARRNAGVLESEHRLYLFVISLLIIPSGLILWGVGAYHRIQWFGLIVGMFLIAMSNTIGIQLSVSYLVDCYREISGEGMVSVILIRNTMSFAFGYGITPWVNGMGLQGAFLLAAGVGMLQVCTVLCVVRWGKKWRMNSAGKYWGFVAEDLMLGIQH